MIVAAFLAASGTAGAQEADPGVRRHDGVGTRVAAVLGDVNGDGVPDYALGSAPGIRGGVRVLSGLTGATLYDVLPLNDGSLNGEYFGQAIAVLGDIGGGPAGAKDGIPDFLAGAPRGARAASPAGYVRIVSGADGTEIRTVTGGNPFEMFGSSVAAIGDVNGDQVPDFVVGSPHTTGTNAGFASVFSGADGSELFALRQNGESLRDNLGRRVAGIGDVNGDGVPDFAVAGHGTDNRGVVHFVSGSDGRRLESIRGRKAGTYLGESIVPFLSADGTRGVAVALGAYAGSGGVYSSKGALLAPLPIGPLGSSVDFDGDGIRDLLHMSPDHTLIAAYESSALVRRRLALHGVFVFPGDETGSTSSSQSFTGLGDPLDDGGSLVVAGVEQANSAVVGRLDRTAVLLRRLRVATALTRDVAADGSSAKGTVILQLTPALQRLQVKLSKVPITTGTTYEIHLGPDPEDSLGAFRLVGTVTLSVRGSGTLSIDGRIAPSSDLGVPSLVSLGGRTVEVRDPSGTVVLSAVLPAFQKHTRLNSVAVVAAVGASGVNARAIVTSNPSNGASRLDVKTTRLPAGVVPTLWIEDAPGSDVMVEAGTFAGRRFVRDTATGVALPGGASDAASLLGRRVEIRDGATVLAAGDL